MPSSCRSPTNWPSLVPPVAVRLRRDFKTVLTLIRAHALLHQATRRKDEAGQIIATLEDYAAVRDLVGDLVAAGVEATVRPEVRETVQRRRAPDRKRRSQRLGKQTFAPGSSWISRRSRAVSPTRLIADTCGTSKTRRADRPGSSSAIRCPTSLRFCPRPSGCTVARLFWGIKNPPPPLCCVCCGQPDRDDDPLLQVADGEQGFTPLHRHCAKAWS